ncbi:MAG TPA: carboxypeptidase regulatory-like domain-containing protein [Longimicrobiales bacterium]|nr:carboxypeptidase regulatory-like domain-containing protein [Longimicrobiales bacterium]
MSPEGVAVALVSATLLLTPAALEAQTLVGQVLDDARGSPVGGAVVRLLDRDGNERAQALADSLGRFTLAPPENGEYVLEAVRLGYEDTRSPLLALRVGGTAPIELMMVPRPIGLAGLEVSAEARATEYLDRIGVTPAILGSRWIPPETIEAIEVKRDMGAILEWSAVPGTDVIRDENTTSGSDRMGLCVSMQRSNTAGGTRLCALIVVDGAVVHRFQVLALDPESIEAMAVLVPREATTIYGTMGGGGAVVIWTKRGRR